MFAKPIVRFVCSAAVILAIHARAMAVDCNTNSIADATEIAGNALLDCNTNGVLDICELVPINGIGIVNTIAAVNGFIDISSSGGSPGTYLGLGDDAQTNTTVPFTSPMMPGNLVTISNNGVLYFGGTGTAAAANTTLPATATAFNGGPALCIFWDDLRTPVTPNGTYYKTVGATPNRTFIVQWQRATVVDNTGSQGFATFQIQLFETPIGGLFAQYLYPDVIFEAASVTTFDNGGSATIGWQMGPTVAAQWSFNTASVSNGQVLSLLAPRPGPTQVSSNATAMLIPENQANLGALSNITIAPFGTVADVNVQLSVRHPLDSNLRMQLAHNATTVSLYNGSPGTGQNFTNTVFDDSAAIAITLTTNQAPFSSTFRPITPLANFAAQQSHGLWQLRVSDAVNLNTGTLLSWSLILKTTVDVDCNTNGTPDRCDGIDSNGDGILDICQDCNTNTIPDPAEGGTDCNTNGVPDACEPDCNTNGTTDDCDLSAARNTTMAATGLPILIPENNTNGINSVINVAAVGNVSDVNVQLSIQHSLNSNLRPMLIHAATTVTLYAGTPSTGGNFTNTVFDQQAIISITGGTAPFTNTYRPPANTLDHFNGHTVAGNWTLRVADVLNLNTGTLLSWSLFLQSPVRADCNTNGIPDECDRAAGAADCNSNNTLDICEFDVIAPQIVGNLPAVNGFIDIHNTGNALSLSNDGTAVVPMPFTNNFVPSLTGVIYNNGVLYFGATGSGTITNTDLPAAPNLFNGGTAYFPFWDDLQVAGRSPFVETIGAPPHRTFILQWYNATVTSAASGFGDFELQLFETPRPNGVFGQYLYKDVVFEFDSTHAFDYGATATIGYQLSQTSFAQWSVNTPSLTDGLVLSLVSPINDCNTNIILDACEAAGNDCNTNNRPDVCEIAIVDCNTNALPDVCDALGHDSNTNGKPDVCEDCNTNGTPDSLEAIYRDCNTNGTMDYCDAHGGGLTDCDNNGTLDVCEYVDCDTNNQYDGCDIATGSSLDCDADGRLDICELGFSEVSPNRSPMTLLPSIGVQLDSIQVNTFGTVRDVDVRVDIGHATDDQLDVFLVHNGVTVTLFTDLGTNGDNFAGTVLDDEAANSITNTAVAIPPFNGTFQPQSPLTAFDGGQKFGKWTLNVTDDTSGTTGTLLSWGLVITIFPTDCNTNGSLDSCEDSDANHNGTLDICEDCNTNGIGDGTEPGYADCNSNLIADFCDVSLGSATDCNTNATLDSCELALRSGINIVAATGLPALIPENNASGRTSTILVATAGPVADVNVQLSIIHTNDADLDITLIHLGITTTLSDDNGSTGDNYTGTVFDDQASVSITATAQAVAPFIGTFRPETPLSRFRRREAAGAWTLRVADDLNANTGTLVGWTLFFQTTVNGDCNTNAVLDACDIAQGLSDCDTNTTPDVCEGGCNTNGIADVCELPGNDCNTNGTPDMCEVASSDCNTNGVIDACDVLNGARDCNTNRRPDVCELATDVNTSSPVLGPIFGDGGGSTQSFVVLNAPSPLGNVTIDIVFNGDFGDSGETFTVTANGTAVGTSAPTGGGGNCIALPGMAHFVVSPAIWNAAIASNPPNVTLIATATTGVNAGSCSTSDIKFTVSYPVGGGDCDTNGTPDVCDTDANNNGTPDVCEDCNTNGTGDAGEPGYLDCNSNQTADFCEITIGTAIDCNLDGTIDNCQFAAADCNTNGTSDLCDIGAGARDCNTDGIPDVCELKTGITRSAVSPEVPQLIPDNAAATILLSTINPMGTVSVSDVNVMLNIPHTSTGDLRIMLIHGGTTVSLSERRGSTGDHFSNTTFDDQASSAISSGAAPFIGAFRPETPLSAFNTQTSGGLWILHMRDLANSNTGTLLSWTLIIKAPPGSNDCDSNGTPDVCQPDINTNGRADSCEDCNTNGIVDPSEPGYHDCNTNNTADFCDLGLGSGTDCNTDGFPDVCGSGDCDTNHTLDACEFGAFDCNTNVTKDICELLNRDCDTNLTLDACDPGFIDCDSNGRRDTCELAIGGDCNTNGTLDSCEFPPANCSPGRLIAVDGSRLLFELDVATAAKTPIGTVTSNVGTAAGLAYDRAHNIMYLTSSSNDSLYTLDLVTGNATLIGFYGSTDIVMHGLEYDDSTGILYGVSSHNNGLYNINKTTGVATLIGTSGLTSFTNLGYNSDTNVMYATNTDTDSLYIINRANGQVTLVGPLNGSTSPNALAYSQVYHTMYMLDNSTDVLYTINLATGAATAVGSTASGTGNNLLGLAFVPPLAAACSTCPGDIGGDNKVDGQDVAGWVRCLLAAPLASDHCACTTGMTTAQFINKLLTDTNTTCP